MTALEPYIFKKIPVQFFGKRCILNTSQELFSCNAVDAGSQLLITSVLKERVLPAHPVIADVGCGTGILSLALLAHHSDSRILAVDRDALALAFTALNCRENGYCVETRPSLGANEIFDERVDLVLSNIPAKAGLPAIRTMLGDFSLLAGSNGIVAVVIVKTLSDFAESVIRDAGGTIVFMNRTREYTIFHYHALVHDGKNAALAPYLRSTVPFDTGSGAIVLDTVWGLGEFDSLSFSTLLVMSMLEKFHVSGKTLVINPGQGYIPVALMQSGMHTVSELHIAGRDYLSLAITGENVRRSGARSPAVHHCALLADIPGVFQTVIAFHEKEAVEGAHELLVQSLARVTEPGGTVIVTGSSTGMHRLERISGTSFTITADKKNRGFRVLVLKRKQDSDIRV